MKTKKNKPIPKHFKHPEFISQKNGTDCGIAALAMLYKMPYAPMKKLVLADYLGKWNGTSIDHARSVGSHMADPCKRWIVCKENRKDIIHKLQDRPAILVVPALCDPAILASGETTDTHAVYWTGSRLYDPAGPDGRVYGHNGAKALKVMEECWILTSDD